MGEKNNTSERFTAVIFRVDAEYGDAMLLWNDNIHIKDNLEDQNQKSHCSESLNTCMNYSNFLFRNNLFKLTATAVQGNIQTLNNITITIMDIPLFI